MSTNSDHQIASRLNGCDRRKEVMECTRFLPHSSGIFRLRDVKLQFESNYNRCCDQQAAIGYRTRHSDNKFPTILLTVVEPVMECDGYFLVIREKYFSILQRDS